ncbi:hypothetical protein NDU88_007761 [Pleurodeles waltl]|uniref:Uncharacterized protein n=1 Tax=Pleurodeles waltl TaxID=8319 RepID=A0AAV7RSP7_PLEWA|nr:hypothetical protein NDU88_007761 [Pleurodeles waltl]
MAAPASGPPHDALAPYVMGSRFSQQGASPNTASSGIHLGSSSTGPPACPSDDPCGWVSLFQASPPLAGLSSVSQGDRPFTIQVWPPAQGSPVGARAPAAAHGTCGPHGMTAHQPPATGPKGRGARDPPSSKAPGTGPAPPGPAESSPVPRWRPKPAPGARSSCGAQPRIQRSSAPPGPVADATCWQRSALPLRSPVRERHDVSQPVPLHAGPGSQPLAPHGGPTPTAPDPGRGSAPCPAGPLRVAPALLRSHLRIQSSPGHFPMSDFFRLFHLRILTAKRLITKRWKSTKPPMLLAWRCSFSIWVEAEGAALRREDALGIRRYPLSNGSNGWDEMLAQLRRTEHSIDTDIVVPPDAELVPA